MNKEHKVTSELKCICDGKIEQNKRCMFWGPVFIFHDDDDES